MWGDIRSSEVVIVMEDDVRTSGVTNDHAG